MGDLAYYSMLHHKILIMKNVVLMICIVFLASCSLSKTEREARNTIDGTWVLNKVTYESSGNFQAKLFNDASASCFELSKWFFRSNNSTGYYDIVNTNCSTGVRNFRWAANEVNESTGNFNFTMKFVDDKNRDIQEDVGYRMDLKYLDANTMTLTQTVNFEGKPFKINLNFARLAQ